MPRLADAAVLVAGTISIPSCLPQQASALADIVVAAPPATEQRNAAADSAFAKSMATTMKKNKVKAAADKVSQSIEKVDR